MISRRRQSSRHAWISRIEDSRGSSRKRQRLFTRAEGRDLVIFFIPGLDPIPAQSVIQSQVARGAPAVLREQSDIFIPAIKRLQLALVVLARSAQKKIREVRSRLCPKKEKAAVKLRNGIDVHLIVVKLAPRLQRVRPNHL